LLPCDIPDQLRDRQVTPTFLPWVPPSSCHRTSAPADIGAFVTRAAIDPLDQPLVLHPAL